MAWVRMVEVKELSWVRRVWTSGSLSERVGISLSFM